MEFCLLATKIHGHRPVRRGRPLTSQTAFGGQLPYKGSLVRPVARFHHSLFEYSGGLLRATNHEPRFFSRAEGYSRRCRQFESVTAQRHLNPRRPANCELRPAGPSGPYSIFSFQQRKISTARAANQMFRARTLMIQYQPDFPRSW